MSTLGIAEIDAILPQTQCGRCSYAGCLPYAKAIVEEGESIDRCLPGGKASVRNIAALLAIAAEPYLAKIEEPLPQIARIREDSCIGCTKCIQACPVDAIIGSAKLMHSIISMECTGCGLCIPPCPMDCIDLKSVETLHYKPAQARQRFRDKLLRQKAPADSTATTSMQNEKLAFIQAAVARATAKRQEGR
jgi:electron transport complex protein RnfB